jgi:hypothetical protein
MNHFFIFKVKKFFINERSPAPARLHRVAIEKDKVLKNEDSIFDVANNYQPTPRCKQGEAKV